LERRLVQNVGGTTPKSRSPIVGLTGFEPATP
jgi:hypothetical protein